MRKNLRFVLKAVAAHVVTYILCGLVFSTLFHYDELFQLGNAQYFMREAYGLSSLIGPIVQVFRGAALGFILLLFRDSFMGKPYAWLRLWAVVAGIGIICTPGPAPVSVEGIVYSQLPLEFHLKIAPELFIQTLLFSIWMTSSVKFSLSEKIKPLLSVTVIAGVGFSLGGILLALVLGVDFMQSATDVFAFVVMFIALITVFFITKWYLIKKNKKRAVLYYLICYAALAGLPTAYNYLSGSLLKSPWSLLISGLPVLVIALFLERKKILQEEKRSPEN